MKTEQDILDVIAKDIWMMDILRTVQKLNLPDWWIGAGFVRSKVWDYLHSYQERTPLLDIDVIYLDKTNTDEANEKNIEQKLSDLYPGIPWSVKNQARMHTAHGHAAYQSAEEGLSKWVETATCVGVRLNKNNKLQLTAPLGIDDLVNLVLRLNPENGGKKELFYERIKKKKWLEKWPNLRIVD